MYFSWKRSHIRGEIPISHFKDEFFSNLHQYQEGFAERLHLIMGSVPSVYGNDGHSKAIIVSLLSNYKNGQTSWSGMLFDLEGAGYKVPQ
ncbi:hypothetical protein ILYODFUR_024111 [Ilyodon furcidens]|uniref:Uncharacterized protein n=1 Tax=Ilyodon furcidens TaxID=33524 RepID=A0ABV0T0T4_9TELE